MKVGDIVRIRIGNANNRDGLTNNSILVKVVITKEPDYAGYTFSAKAIDSTLNQHPWWYKDDEILLNRPSRPRKGNFIGEQVFQP